MEKSKLDINPVFNHRKSVALLDTAEALVDSLDSLSVCLKHIEEKYMQNAAGKDGKKVRLYETLRENVENARELTDTLKREKWRLSRRQMSVELRMGELEEVRNHMKEDMSMMNMTVEDLSMRIIQLENALCESQDQLESAEAEAAAQSKRVEYLETTVDEMKAKEMALNATIESLRSVGDSKTKRKYEELNNKMECLILENHRLKEIIRESDSPDKAQKVKQSTDADDTVHSAQPGTPPVSAPKASSGRDLKTGHSKSEVAFV